MLVGLFVGLLYLCLIMFLDTAPKEILDEFNQLAEEEDHDPFAYVFAWFY